MSNKDLNNVEAWAQEETDDPDNSGSETSNQSPSTAANDSFPIEALPQVLRDMCGGLAELHGVPVEFPAALAIAAIGGAVGKGLQVDTWRGLRTFPNVYVLAGVLSGLAKSTVGTPIFAPLAQCEARHRHQHAKELPMLKSELMLVQRQIAALVKQGQEQNE